MLLALAFAPAAQAQAAYTPEKGSAERKAILDALRVPVERQLKQKVVFVADNFKVQGNWAFVGGTAAEPERRRAGLSRDRILRGERPRSLRQQLLRPVQKNKRQMAGRKIYDRLYRCLLR